MTYEEIYAMLKQGKRLAVNESYNFKDYPVVRLVNQAGEFLSYDADLVPVSQMKRESVPIRMNTDIKMPQKENVAVQITSYESMKSVPILYIYANKQMTKLFAKLKDGETVPYHLGILSLDNVIGEYLEMTERRVRLTFFKSTGKYYTEEVELFPLNAEPLDIIDKIRDEYDSYIGMDISVTFDGFEENESYYGVPCLIKENTRKRRLPPEQSYENKIKSSVIGLNHVVIRLPYYIDPEVPLVDVRDTLLPAARKACIVNVVSDVDLEEHLKYNTSKRPLCALWVDGQPYYYGKFSEHHIKAMRNTIEALTLHQDVSHALIPYR